MTCKYKGLIRLTADQLLVGYLMSKFDPILNVTCIITIFYVLLYLKKIVCTELYMVSSILI